jgi:hypothetical protein
MYLRVASDAQIHRLPKGRTRQSVVRRLKARIARGASTSVSPIDQSTVDRIG